MRKYGRGKREDLVGADVDSDSFVGEKRKVGGVVVVIVIGIVRVAVIVSVGGFGQGV